MRTLRDLCEGLLDKGFDSGMDEKIMAELGDFIGVLKSLEFETNNRGTYGYGEQELCDAAEKVAYSKKFKRIAQAEAKKMIASHEPGTILVIDWSERGSHGWCVIDTESGEYFKVGCLLKRESPSAPWTSIEHDNIQKGHEYRALGRGGTNPCYILPQGICKYLKKAIK